MRKVLISLVVIAIVRLGSIIAVQGEGDAHQKVTRCHATRSQTNPFVSVTVSINAAGDAGHAGGHDGHSDDIIPAYTFTDETHTVAYPGKNLGYLSQYGTTGQAILDNGCRVPHAKSSP